MCACMHTHTYAQTHTHAHTHTHTHTHEHMHASTLAYMLTHTFLHSVFDSSYGGLVNGED